MPSKIKKRGNSYLFTVTNGYQGSKQITYTKTVKGIMPSEVKKEYKLFETECMAGNIIPSTSPRMTLKQFFTYWQDNYATPNLSPGTIKKNSYTAERLLAALGHLQLHKITPQHCLQLLEQLREPNIGINNKSLSSATIHAHYSLLNELFNFAVKWDFLGKNPLTKIDAPRRIKTVKELPDKENITNLLQLLAGETAKYKDNPKHKKRYIECLSHQLWTMLAFAQGLRTEEIFGLQKGDIKKNIMHISRAAVYVSGEGITVKTTKTVSSQRALALSQATINILKAYLAATSDNKIVSAERWLFAKEDGTVAHPQAFSRFLRRFCVRHKLPNITPHLLRHMYGSYLIKQGMDLATTSHQLGHTNKSFTADTYIHVTERIDTRSAQVMQGIIDNMLK